MKSLNLYLALAAFLICSASAVSFFDVVVQEWELWKVTHNKSYTSVDEDRIRLKIYMENSHRIHKHNTRAHNGKHSYFLKMNHFGDLLHHEFVAKVNGYLGQKQLKGSTYIPAENVVVPLSMDWREKGAVTPVKNQGQCGSCWSFSTTGAVEGQDFRKKGKLVSLSEQNLVDCSGKYGNQGCNGGLMDLAFKYIKENRGIDTEESYPYEGVQRKCRYDPSKKGGWDTGFVDIASGSEEELTHALASVGPVAVAIDASNESFQFYSHGVYNEENCSSEALDHGVLAVGYGTDEKTGEDYYIVKNSWSESWGMGGYIHMARNKENMCGIATQASYPLV